MSINRTGSLQRALWSAGLLVLLMTGSVSCLSKSTHEGSSSKGSGVSGDSRVIVYGRKSCPICESFVKNLNERSIAYEFRSVNDRAQASAMWAVVRERFPGRESVGLPVVVMGEQAWIRPKFGEFLDYWNTTR